MKRRWFFATTAAVLAWAAGCQTSSEGADPGPKPAPAPSAEGGAAAAAAGAALPCDVEQVLAARCVSCHSAQPSAPMPLVTYADLAAPAKTNPSKRTADLVVERIQDRARPMPPATQLADAEVATLVSWVRDGMPGTGCAADEGSTRRKDGGAECFLASDCPDNLVCRGGKCDLECVTDKDCTPTWTCEETRCHPPGGSVTPSTPAVSYGDIASSAAWALSDVRSLTNASYSGAVFDGRWVYFAPDGSSGKVLRYDSTIPFAASRAWAAFDLTGMDAKAFAYRGTVFDGRYVYFVPASSGAQFARYDTRLPYADPSSWSLFDLTAITSSVGFIGATFDGRYLYLVPGYAGAVAVRFDTQGAIASTASWSTITLTTIDAQARSFAGAVFDGRFVYYVPTSTAGVAHGVIARYDVEAPFSTATSWSTVDLTTFSPAAKGFRTGSFDGRYLYLVPGWTAPSPAWSSTTVARLDTTAGFSASASWTFFDVSELGADAAGFNAAGFDGRYLFLTPGYNTDYHGVTVRYDTRSPIGDKASWSKFDITTTASSAKNLRGAAFDGRYMYFAPSGGSAMRFDARPTGGPAVKVPGGSFY